MNYYVIKREEDNYFIAFEGGWERWTKKKHRATILTDEDIYTPLMQKLILETSARLCPIIMWYELGEGT